MNNPNPVATYALRLGDNGLVLAQRLGAWCGHAPELEIDLALANIGLDLLGQARNFLSYAAELNGCGDVDPLAFGKQGLHSEHLGPLLAEMQYLQRSHPGLQW